MAAPAHRPKPKRESHHIVYLAYSNCIQAITHFDNIQTTFRVMTSTILLATFAGIGFIFSGESKQLPIDAFIAVVLVCAIGLSAICALWHLDVVFYERLLISFFTEAYDLEERFAWLPKIHHKMLIESSNKEKPRNLVFFYIGCGTTLIATAGLMVVYLLRPYGTLTMLAAIFGTVLLLFFFTAFLKKKTESLEKLVRILKEKKRKDHGSP